MPARIFEDFQQPYDDDYYLLLDNKKYFAAKMVPVEPGAMVHQRVLLNSERKFSIEQVLDDQWDGYDDDIHCVGNFIAWELADTMLCTEEADGKKKKRKKFK